MSRLPPSCPLQSPSFAVVAFESSILKALILYVFFQCASGELCVQGSSERGSDASVSPASFGGTPEPSVREPCSCARDEHGKIERGQIGCGQNDRGSCGRATVDRATVGCATVGCASVGGMTVG
jgi:hypothetical protein